MKAGNVPAHIETDVIDFYETMKIQTVADGTEEIAVARKEEAIDEIAAAFAISSVAGADN